MKKNFIDKSFAYLYISYISAKINFAYRYNLVFQLLYVLFQVYLLKVIWTAVYMHQESINHIQLQVLISYLTLTNLQTWLLTPRITDFLQARVRTGDVTLDMVRPVDFLFQLLSQQFGLTLGLVPFVLIASPLILLAGGVQFPASIDAMIFYVISLALAYLISSLMGVLMGLISVWMLEVTGIDLIYRFVNLLFSGALIPLWFFPPALLSVASILPFYTTAFLPASIYLGQIHDVEIFSSLATQLGWVIVLYLLTKLIWYKAQRHIMVQGG